MTAPHPDQDLRKVWKPFVDDSPHEDLGPILDRRREATPGPTRRPWKRRLAPQVGVAISLLAVAGTAAATGVLSFSELFDGTSQNNASAQDLRALIGELEPSSGGSAARTGTLTRDGLDIAVAIDDRRLCLSTEGNNVSGSQRYDRPEPAGPTREPPPFEDVPPVDEVRRRPTQVACVDLSRLDGELPVITGSDDRGSWIVALAPDQIAAVDAAAGNKTVELQKSQNLAIGRSTAPFTRVRWLTADGRSRASSIDLQ